MLFFPPASEVIFCRKCNTLTNTIKYCNIKKLINLIICFRNTGIKKDSISSTALNRLSHSFYNQYNQHWIDPIFIGATDLKTAKGDLKAKSRAKPKAVLILWLLVPRPLIFDFTFCWFGHILFLNDIFLTFWQDVWLLPNSIFKFIIRIM